MNTVDRVVPGEIGVLHFRVCSISPESRKDTSVGLRQYQRCSRT